MRGRWPVVKRYLLPNVGVWVWGIFATRRSRTPYIMASNIRTLSNAENRREARRERAREAANSYLRRVK